jgi:hypothetical protein
MAVVAAAWIFATQRIRYRRTSQGINAERINANVPAVFSLPAMVVLLGALSLIAALTF